MNEDSQATNAALAWWHATLDGAVVQRGPDGQARLTVQLPAGYTVQLAEQAPCSTGDTLCVPAGQWERVRLWQGPALLRDSHVAAGEVFLIAGQSNSANWGEERLQCSDARVRAFDGRAWHAAHDPLPGTQDQSTGGSPWPMCGALLAQALNCAVGFASCGFGGTSIRAWQAGPLQQTLVERARALSGLRGVLWHQGEADADVGMTSAEYAALHAALRHALAQHLGRAVPWWVARATFVPGREAHTLAGVRQAQESMAAKGEVYAGPDTDLLLGPMRHSVDGIHFSGAGLRAHGRAWSDMILAKLDVRGA